ncbi:MAG: HAMP domain-containing histidine kinase, partial [Proteobacteria bacterium]|nr:HAMP domain-containing histidine kinase [Desulfobulbaceae bacterium]MBU4151845.1 HAMP domain-containing histidine kinase [Pseudomonadota bacterium]
TFLFLVHVVVGAILLPMTMAWGLAGFSALCYGGFFLPVSAWCGYGAPQALCHTEPVSPEMSLHLQGMWVAFAITAFFVVFFVTRIQEALTVHRNTESRLRESQLKNERLASLAALSAGAAHEFATPLSTIAVAAGELYREMSQGAHEVWLEDLRLIRSQVARCRDILSQMAADAGEPLGEGIVSLRVEDLVGEVRASLEPQRQARLVIDCSDPDATITIPKRSLHRVLRGLVSNAFHASPLSATVTLKVVVGHDGAHFTVSDQGCGMDANILASAREPFFTTKEAGQGLGLGLYLASTMAERLGGGLEIDSAPGQGTTVYFWISKE